MQDSAKDEIIFSAIYTPWRVCLAFIAYSFCVCFALGLAHEAILGESYLLGSVLLLSGLVMLLLFIDTLFSEQLVFYSDRVAKAWRILGSRTIYYLNATVADTRRGMVSIRETDANGRRLWMQIPILIQDSLFSFKARRELMAIIDYLTDDQRYGKRLIKKSSVDKDALDSYIAFRMRRTK